MLWKKLEISMKKKFKQQKRHYYSFAYTFQYANGNIGYGCKTISKSNTNITQSTINHVIELARKSIDHYVEVVLITSINYLGYMTEKEFFDE